MYCCVLLEGGTVKCWGLPDSEVTGSGVFAGRLADQGTFIEMGAGDDVGAVSLSGG